MNWEFIYTKIQNFCSEKLSGIRSELREDADDRVKHGAVLPVADDQREQDTVNCSKY
jgi:hypothetical protein